MDDDAKVKRLLHASYLTLDVELDCATCLELMPTYVDRELAGADAARLMPALHHQLELCRDSCRDCFEAYEMLRDLAALNSHLPEKDELLRQLTPGRSNASQAKVNDGTNGSR